MHIYYLYLKKKLWYHVLNQKHNCIYSNPFYWICFVVLLERKVVHNRLLVGYYGDTKRKDISIGKNVYYCFL